MKRHLPHWRRHRKKKRENLKLGGFHLVAAIHHITSQHDSPQPNVVVVAAAEVAAAAAAADGKKKKAMQIATNPEGEDDRGLGRCHGEVAEVGAGHFVAIAAADDKEARNLTPLDSIENLPV